MNFGGYHPGSTDHNWFHHFLNGNKQSIKFCNIAVQNIYRK